MSTPSALTLFTLPKRFVAPFDVIQHNALRSWAALQPRPELLLFGDETGTREAAALYGARHLPELAANDLGTPRVDHLFRTATRHTHTSHQGFVNADIILDPALPSLLKRIFAWRKNTLIVSRRWDLDVREPLVTHDADDWFAPLARRARTEGSLYSYHGMDVFIFPTGLFDDMPPFSIGWPGAKYDNWLVYAARRKGAAVVDVTDALTNVHQNHPVGSPNPAKAREHWINLDHLGGHGCCFDILDATHIVGRDGYIRRRLRKPTELRRSAFRFAQRMRYRLRRRLLGFSYANAA